MIRRAWENRLQWIGTTDLAVITLVHALCRCIWFALSAAQPRGKESSEELGILKACEFMPLEGMPSRLKNVGAALFRLGYVSAGLPDLTGIIIRSGHGASVNG